MCGLVTIFSPKANISTKTLTEFYLRQRNRGTDGYGFSYITPTGSIVVKRFEFEAECFLELAKVKSWLVQFHHRNPTSTNNNAFQNHPIVRRTAKGFYSLTHNGVISNHFDLRTKDFKDVEYSTKSAKDLRSNDSESLLHDVVNHLENDTPLQSEGSIAFVLLEGDERGKFKALHFARNSSNPLRYAVYKNTGIYVLSSINDDEEAKEEFMIENDKLFTVTLTKNKKVKLDIKDLPFPERKKYVSSVYNPATATTTQSRFTTPATTTEKKIGLPPARKLTESDVRRVAHDDYMSMLGYAHDLLRDIAPLNKASLTNDKLDALKDLEALRKELIEVSNKAYGMETRKVQEIIKQCYDERQRLLTNDPEFIKEISERVEKEREKESESAGVGFTKKKESWVQSIFSKREDTTKSMATVTPPTLSDAMDRWENEWEERGFRL